MIGIQTGTLANTRRSLTIHQQRLSKALFSLRLISLIWFLTSVYINLRELQAKRHFYSKLTIIVFIYVLYPIISSLMSTKMDVYSSIILIKYNDVLVIFCLHSTFLMLYTPNNPCMGSFPFFSEKLVYLTII